MTAAAAHGDGDVDARSLRDALGAVGREVAHRLARPIRAVRRRRPGQRLHPRIALGLAARLRAVHRPLRQVQRRRGHRRRQPALLERRLLRAVAGVMYLGNRDVLGLGGEVALQCHHIAAGDRQRVARHQRHVAVQAAHRAAGVGQRAAGGIGLERLLAVGDAETTIAEQAALLALAVVFLAVRVLRCLQGEVVAGGQHHVAGADDLRALRQQIVARRDLHRVATQAARHRNAVVALVVRGRRLAGEELFLARLLVHHAVVLFLRRRQRHVVAGSQGDAAGLARHRRRCQGQVVACAHHDVATGTQLRALHVFVVGGGNQRVALAHAAVGLRAAVHHRLAIDVVAGLHRQRLAGADLRCLQGHIVARRQHHVAGALHAANRMRGLAAALVVACIVRGVGAVRERLRAQGQVVTGHQLGHPIGAGVAYLCALQGHVAATHHRQDAAAIGSGDVEPGHARDRLLMSAALQRLHGGGHVDIARRPDAQRIHRAHARAMDVNVAGRAQRHLVAADAAAQVLDPTRLQGHQLTTGDGAGVGQRAAHMCIDIGTGQ